MDRTTCVTFNQLTLHYFFLSKIKYRNQSDSEQYTIARGIKIEQNKIHQENVTKVVNVV